MLGLIGNTLVSATPVAGDLHAVLHEDRVEVLANGRPLQFGVAYFIVDRKGLDAQLDKATGRFTLGKRTRNNASITFRAVAGGQHFDLPLVIETPLEAEEPTVA
jgi:hypothetical protein